MKLSKEQINKFIAIHKKVFGETIAEAEAYDLASRLLRLSKILLKPPDPP